MIKSMIQELSAEEREAMMLKMMPLMLERTQPHTLLDEMLKQCTRSINIYQLGNCVYGLIKSEKIQKQSQKYFPKLMNTLLPHKEVILEITLPLLQKLMPKMMFFAMPMMAEIMPKMMGGENCPLRTIAAGSEEKKNFMATCMVKILPHCFKMALPLMESPKRQDFAIEVISQMASMGSNHLNAEQQKQFEVSAIKSVMNRVIENQDGEKCCL